MDINGSAIPFHNGVRRSSNGCWTCRVRRKKCDEKHPACEACAALQITCHYEQEKPEWMDGGARQEKMTERIKCEIREKAAHRPRGQRTVYIDGNRVPTDQTTTDEPDGRPQELRWTPATPIIDPLVAIADNHQDRVEPSPKPSNTLPQRGADCAHISKEIGRSIPFERSDTILLMFYLEHLLPFLFPFYRPSIFQGGRAWILEMMISSPVVRQVTLCQSSYFFSLALDTTNHDRARDGVLTQTMDAFKVLRQSLHVIDGAGIAEHPHGAVRIMTSILQVQRFEIAVLSFGNCHSHLNAALALFKQLLACPSDVEPREVIPSFKAVIDRLGPPPQLCPTQSLRVPSAEQAAFCFSSALLILDDIIASSVLQEQPKLYEYHRSLLVGTDGTEPVIDLAAVIGCQNWVLLHIGEISVLDAWKQQCKRGRNLDVAVLVHRATIIKTSLEFHLEQLKGSPVATSEEKGSLLDILTADPSQHPTPPASQTPLVTRVWAHAALLHLSIVVSGWQPFSCDVRYHVSQILELLTHQTSPPAMLRTMGWPFCVAGCLAEPAQEARFRGLVWALQPRSMFGTAWKALEVMEAVWRGRDTEGVADWDLAACFTGNGGLALLV
jgi:hypothetical protein